MNIVNSYQSDTPGQTADIAAELIPVVNVGVILYLSGALGAGKTEFVRGLVAAMGGDVRELASPTYALVNEYQLSFFPLFHLDLYRLGDPKEVLGLGLEELRQSGPVVIEWPEHGQPYLGPPDIQINIDIDSPTKRTIRVSEYAAK